MPRVVTLITDFGTGSGYVAEMKGCLLQAQNPFTLIDIAHDLPAQDLRATAWLVGQACFAFPAQHKSQNVNIHVQIMRIINSLLSWDTCASEKGV